LGFSSRDDFTRGELDNITRTLVDRRRDDGGLEDEMVGLSHILSKNVKDRLVGVKKNRRAL